MQVEQKKTDLRKTLGETAENMAVRLLNRRGLAVVDRNFRAKRGEVDIVCVDGDTLVFVEVRSSTTRYLKSPALTVTPRKQARIIAGANGYISAKRPQWDNCRFDVIAVHFESTGVQLEWIRDAFRPQPSSRSAKFM